MAASWLACRLPEGPLVRFAEFAGELWYRLTPDRAAQARRNLGRVAATLAGRVAGPRWCGRPRPTRARSSGSSGLAYRHAARYYLEVARAPALRPGDIDEQVEVETPDVGGRGVRIGAGFDLSSGSISGRSSCPACCSRRGPVPPSRRWSPSTTPDSRNGSCAPAGPSACGSSACVRRVASCRRRCGTAPASGSSAIAT